MKYAYTMVWQTGGAAEVDEAHDLATARKTVRSVLADAPDGSWGVILSNRDGYLRGRMRTVMVGTRKRVVAA